MELKSIHGEVIFSLKGAQTIAEVVKAAIAAGKSLLGAYLSKANLSKADLSGANLRGADLRRADLRGADLRGANLSGADLRGAYLSGADLRDATLSIVGKVSSLRTYASSLYPYQVWAVVAADGKRYVRMGCRCKTLEEWEAVGIRNSNVKEFPNNGSEKCEERVSLFEMAKAAALRMPASEGLVL